MLKKDRVVDIESVWFACCAAGALPLPLMLRTGERLVARGFTSEVSELVVMLVETLSEADRSEEGLDVVHGTLYAPELFDYLQTSYDAYLSMERMRAPICFVGHSHVPVALVLDEIISYNLDPVVTVPPGGKVIVNVGSVGQPRDRDPRASFVIYDSERQTATRHRVHYDIDAVFAKVQAAGLPLALGERLRLGR